VDRLLIRANFSRACWGSTLILIGLGLMLPWPDIRILSAFGILFLLPGAWVTRSLRRDIVEALPLAFCASLVLLIPAAIVAYAAPLPHASVKWLYVGTVIAVAVLFLRSRPREMKIPGWAVIILVMGGAWAVLGFYAGIHQSLASDNLSTLIILRKLIERPFLAPFDYYMDQLPLTPIDTADKLPVGCSGACSYQIYYLVVTLAADVARADVARVFLRMPILLGPLMLMAFFTFVKSAFDDPKIGLAAAVLFMWASTLYDISSTITVVAQSLVMTIPFHLALARLFISLKEGIRPHLPLASALGALAVAVYLGALFVLVVSMFFFGLWLLIISRDWPALKHVTIFLAGMAAMSAPYLGLVLPYYMADQRVVAVATAPHHVDRFLMVAGWRIVDPAFVFNYLGGISGWRTWAFAGGLLMFVPLLRHRATPWGAFFLSGISATPLLQFNPLAVEAMLHVLYPGKIIKFIPLIGVSAGIPVLAWGIVQGLRWLAFLRRGILISRIAGALAFCALLFLGWTYGNSSTYLRNNDPLKGFLVNPIEMYRELRNHVESGSVVASVSLKIGAYANVFLPPVPSLQDYARIFDPAVGRDETESLLNRYHVQYILNFIPKTPLRPKSARQSYGLEPVLLFPESKFDRWPKRFEPVHAERLEAYHPPGTWKLYRFRPGEGNH